MLETVIEIGSQGAGESNDFTGQLHKMWKMMVTGVGNVPWNTRGEHKWPTQNLVSLRMSKWARAVSSQGAI